MRFMMVYKPADTKAAESGVPPTAAEMETMGAFIGEMARAGCSVAFRCPAVMMGAIQS